MDATIQIANVKIVTAEAIAAAEAKVNTIVEADKTASFFLQMVFNYYFMLM